MNINDNINDLFNAFQTTTDISERNEIALYLCDNKVIEFIPVAMKYLIENKENRGTIIYALHEVVDDINFDEYFSIFVDMILYGNFEEKNMTLDLLCLSQNQNITLETTYRALSSIVKSNNNDVVLISDLLSNICNLLKNID